MPKNNTTLDRGEHRLAASDRGEHRLAASDRGEHRLAASDRGETCLTALLQTMEPKCLPEQYVFVTVAGAYGDYAELDPIASFKEAEGLTLVVNLARAEQAKLAFDSVFRCISLTVHSSLEAVGLTAAVASKLAEYEISANVIAGYYHDHIFVPAAQTKRALQALAELN